jgi:hypothetical protein
VKPGDRVRVVKDPDELVVGWEGHTIKFKWGKWRILLDNDEYTSDFYEDELEVID